MIVGALKARPVPHQDAKHRAKRLNEGLKLAATLFDSIAIVTFAAAFINPIANKHYDVLSNGGWLLRLGAVAAHIFGQAFLGSSAQRTDEMTIDYALQIFLVIAGMGTAALATAWIAVRAFDRETDRQKRDEAARR